MPSFYRTQTLKIEAQPIFSVVNAASAKEQKNHPCFSWVSMSESLPTPLQSKRGSASRHSPVLIADGSRSEGWRVAV